MGEQTREKVATSSGEVLPEQLRKLRSLFPEAFSEGKVDFDKLKATLGAALDPSPGRFSFTWTGKGDALALLQTPSHATLEPRQGESVGFDKSANAFIEGDNLEVLKLLYRPYFGRVKLIYIDPPYNTGQDFIYPDNYVDPLKTYLTLTGQADAAGNLLTSNPETSGRYHSSWLSMMYPRLFLARQLLREDGVICVSIDDHEVHHLRMLMNEIFGEENFVANCVWQKRYSRENRGVIGDVHDYLMFYAREKDAFAKVSNRLPLDDESKAVYRNPNNDPQGPWRGIPMTAQGTRPNQMYAVTTPTGVVHHPPKGRCWSTIESEYLKLREAGRIWFGADGNGQPNIIRYLSEVDGLVPWTWWPHEEVGHTDEAKKEVHGFFGKEDTFDTPKPVRLMKRVLHIATQPQGNELVLDFFAGTCSLAQALLELNRADGGNRRFIMVQLPEPTGNAKFPTIAEMGKERIRRVLAELSQGAEGAAEDLGVKVFRLSAPSIRPWTPDYSRDPSEYEQKLSLFNDPLVPGWTVANVLHELALREGLSLNARFEERVLSGGIGVYLVTDPETELRFVACLGKHIPADIARQLDLRPDSLLICRDVALDDSTAANMALQCRLKTI